MDEKLKPCPFCGMDVTDSRQHAEDCYFTLHKALNTAPDADLSLLPAVLAAWNRRAAASIGETK